MLSNIQSYDSEGIQRLDSLHCDKQSEIWVLTVLFGTFACVCVCVFMFYTSHLMKYFFQIFSHFFWCNSILSIKLLMKLLHVKNNSLHVWKQRIKSQNLILCAKSHVFLYSITLCHLSIFSHLVLIFGYVRYTFQFTLIWNGIQPHRDIHKLWLKIQNFQFLTVWFWDICAYVCVRWFWTRNNRK